MDAIFDSSSQQNEQNSDYTGIWIPREILETPELTLSAKLVWAIVHALDTKERGCYATNAYFMKRLDIGERGLQNALAVLKEFGLIFIEQISGYGRVIRCAVKAFTRNIFKKVKGDSNNYNTPAKNAGGVPPQKMHPYTKECTYSNSNSNARTHDNKERVEQPPITQLSEQEAQKSINFLNSWNWPNNFKPTEKDLKWWSQHNIATHKNCLRLLNEKNAIKTIDRIGGYYNKLVNDLKNHSNDKLEVNRELFQGEKNKGFLKPFNIEGKAIVHVSGKNKSLESNWEDIKKWFTQVLSESDTYFEKKDATKTQSTFKKTEPSMPQEPQRKVWKNERNLPVPNTAQKKPMTQNRGEGGTWTQEEVEENKLHMNQVYETLSPEQKKQISFHGDHVKFQIVYKGREGDISAVFALPPLEFRDYVKQYIEKLNTEKKSEIALDVEKEEEIDFKMV